MTKKKDVPTFTKEQLLSSKHFEGRTDFLNALLVDGTYTIADAESKINEFMKGEV